MTELSREEIYWVWLSSIDGVFPKWFYMLQGAFLEPRNVWDCPGDILKRLPNFPQNIAENIKMARTDQYLEGLLANIRAKGIAALTAASQKYPYTLCALPDPPPVLYIKGALPELWERSVSVVGTRNPTRNGKISARNMAYSIALQDVAVVSGMARGIDTAAHTGALEAGGRTVAVLGSGVDVVYPKENRELYDRIVECGAVISEFRPGTPPLSGNFPRRNRIIAALSAATIVSEGGEKSGARITADIALSLGRQVFAIPCDIGSDVAALPIALLKSGAALISESRDLMDAMGWKIRDASGPKKESGKNMLDFLQEQIYNSLLKGELTAEQLAGVINVPISELNTALTMMEFSGVVVCLPGNYFSIKI
jgi:DNA processing protein